MFIQPRARKRLSIVRDLFPGVHISKNPNTQKPAERKKKNIIYPSVPLPELLSRNLCILLLSLGTIKGSNSVYTGVFVRIEFGPFSPRTSADFFKVCVMRGG